MDNIRNFSYSTVATAPFPSTSGTSLIVQTGDGAQYPTGAFQAIAWPPSVIPRASNAEIMRCTVAGDTFTLTRAQEGSNAQPIAIGYQIVAGITAAVIAQILAACDPVGSAATAQSNAEAFATAAAAAAQAAAIATAEAYADAKIQAMFPVGGTPYITLTNTNPNTTLGFGTWQLVSGVGKFLAVVGTGTDKNGGTQAIAAGNDTSLGEYKHTLLAAESGTPDLAHTVNEDPHNHTFEQSFNSTNAAAQAPGYNPLDNNASEGTGSAKTGLTVSDHPAANAVNGHNNIPPAFGIYMWIRTA